MHDIEQPQFYDSQNIASLIAELHKAGLYNLSQLIQSQFVKINELEVEMEEAVEAASEQGFNSGYEEAQYEWNRNNPKVENFASWYLKEFEPDYKKKIKFKTIGDTTFVIMTEDNYNFLKNEFHKQLD